MGAEPVLLLPRDPDASAAARCDRLAAHFHSSSRSSSPTASAAPWRRGTVGVALGAAGCRRCWTCAARPDLFGHALRVTQTGFADEIAGAASLVMGQADEARRWCWCAGCLGGADAPAATLVRTADEDLFR